MKKIILIATLAASVACSSGPTEDVDSTSQALTLPLQPFPGFILPGVVGTTLFGTPTPVGISTINGLGAGSNVSLFNLLNTSGVYHNDYGWAFANTTQICNLASPGICLSGVAGTGANVVLTTSGDANSFAFTFQGGMLKSLRNGMCIHAATLTSGAALSWSACSSGTPFAGIGYHAQIQDDAGWVFVTFLGRNIEPLQNQPNSAWQFSTAMDAGFYQLFSATSFPGGYVYDAAGRFEFNTNAQPTACPGSTTTTTASMAPTQTGIGTACSGSWMYGGGSSYVQTTGGDGNFTIQYQN